MDILWQEIITTFTSFFTIPQIPAQFVLQSVGLALLFGAIWVAAYYPPLFKGYWIWVLMIAGIFSTVIFTSFLQLPLQYFSTQIFDQFLSRQNLVVYALAVSVPASIIAGLIQVGSRLLPLVIFWIYNKKNLDAKTGLMFGAAIGAAFGVIDAFHVHNQIFAMGWSLSLSQQGGAVMLVPFLEKLVTVGFHTGAMALAGYGLAKGKGWQFYLISSLLYVILNYASVLVVTEVINLLQVELIIVLLTILAAGSSLWLRWNDTEKTAEKTVKKEA